MVHSYYMYYRALSLPMYTDDLIEVYEKNHKIVIFHKHPTQHCLLYSMTRLAKICPPGF